MGLAGKVIVKGKPNNKARTFQLNLLIESISSHIDVFLMKCEGIRVMSQRIFEGLEPTMTMRGKIPEIFPLNYCLA